MPDTRSKKESIVAFRRALAAQPGTTAPRSRATSSPVRQDAARVDHPWRNGCSWATQHDGEVQEYTIIGAEATFVLHSISWAASHPIHSDRRTARVTRSTLWRFEPR